MYASFIETQKIFQIIKKKRGRLKAVAWVWSAQMGKNHVLFDFWPLLQIIDCRFLENALIDMFGFTCKLDKG